MKSKAPQLHLEYRFYRQLGTHGGSLAPHPPYGSREGRVADSILPRSSAPSAPIVSYVVRRPVMGRLGW